MTTIEESRIIAEEVVKQLNDARNISPDTHESHHLWVERTIKKEMKKELRNDAIKQRVFGSLVLTFIGGILSATGMLVINYWEHIFGSNGH